MVVDGSGRPTPPLNLLGDFAGGFGPPVAPMHAASSYTCARLWLLGFRSVHACLGIMMALFERGRSGRGQVMAYIVMAYIVMASTAMASIVMALFDCGCSRRGQVRRPQTRNSQRKCAQVCPMEMGWQQGAGF